jgi:hypothetical protein
LLYLDPHVNQISIQSKNSLKINTNYFSYYPRPIYKIDLKNISPAFTTGFQFRSIAEYFDICTGFGIHNSFSHSIFKFKQFDHNYNKNMSSKKLKVVIDEVDNAEDDFCIIDYKEEDCDNSEY